MGIFVILGEEYVGTINIHNVLVLRFYLKWNVSYKQLGDFHTFKNVTITT